MLASVYLDGLLFGLLLHAVNGEAWEIRTPDELVNGQLLFQLS